MVSCNTLAMLILPVLSAAGIYCTWNFAERNGLFQLIRDNGPEYLPDTEIPLKLRYSGLWIPVDYMLTVLDITFWPILDGRSPGLTMQSFHFAGQWFACWTAFEVEGRRVGNRWSLLSLTFIWGILMQSVAFTIIGPLYCLVHLFLSPASLSSSITTPSAPSTNLLVSPRSVYLLPLSIGLGYVVPAVLITLPSPTYTSYSMRQDLMALWQIFPLTVTILHGVLSVLISILLPAQKTYHSSAERNTDLLGALRFAYTTAFAVASMTHVAVFTLSVSSVILPHIFQASIIPHLHPRDLFIPPSPTSTLRVRDIAEGMHIFLRYDEIIGFTATLLWATALVRNARKAPLNLHGWIQFLTRIVVMTVCAGPAGAMIALIWERDELILGGVV